MDEIVDKILDLDELYAAGADVDMCIAELVELALAYQVANSA